LQIHSARYIQSSPDVTGCPKTDFPEFAFIGRSNVGKSSLINMVTGRAKLALTSSKPGKTRNINHFLINEKWYIVDLPGYGYAQISQLQRDLWLRNIQGYFLRRENLKNVFLLIDASIPPQKKDIEFANWMGEHQVPFCIVFTKTDKEKQLKMQLNVKAFKAELTKTWEELPMFIISSVEKKTGKEEILKYIGECMEKPVKAKV
jgi:GTP-binding protein